MRRSSFAYSATLRATTARNLAALYLDRFGGEHGSITTAEDHDSLPPVEGPPQGCPGLLVEPACIAVNRRHEAALVDFGGSADPLAGRPQFGACRGENIAQSRPGRRVAALGLVTRIGDHQECRTWIDAWEFVRQPSANGGLVALQAAPVHAPSSLRAGTHWHDKRTSTGAEWKEEINAQLDSAGLIPLLVSPAFLASDYCYDVELKRALELHKKRSSSRCRTRIAGEQASASLERSENHGYWAAHTCAARRTTDLQELTQRIGHSASFLRHLEVAHAIPSTRVLSVLARELDVSVADLLEDTPPGEDRPGLRSMR